MTSWMKRRMNKAVANMLREQLGPGEEVLKHVTGIDESVKRLGVSDPRLVFLVATNKRLIFYRAQVVGYELKSFRYESISSFEVSKGFVYTTLRFTASGNDVTVEKIDEDATEFVLLVQQLMS
jgi:hypothetical protein